MSFTGGLARWAMKRSGRSEPDFRWSSLIPDTNTAGVEEESGALLRDLADLEVRHRASHDCACDLSLDQLIASAGFGPGPRGPDPVMFNSALSGPVGALVARDMEHDPRPMPSAVIGWSCGHDSGGQGGLLGRLIEPGRRFPSGRH